MHEERDSGPGLKSGTEFGRSFLNEPQSLPNGSQHFPLGPNHLRVTFGKLGLDFRYLDAGLTQIARERYGHLVSQIAQDADPRAAVSVYRAASSCFHRVDLMGKEYTFDVHNNGESIRMAGPGFCADLHGQSIDRGTIWLSGSNQDWENALAFNNYFRVACAYRFFGMDGMVMHSAAIADATGAFLLVGPSGAGKSTLSRMAAARGFSVLNDDANTIWWERGRYHAMGQPLSGEFDSALLDKRRHPLRAVFHLDQGADDSVDLMSFAQSAASLFGSCPFLNNDDRTFHELFDAICRLVAAVPQYRLTFTLSDHVIDHMLDRMKH